MARREFLIAPVVTEAATLANARIRVEYPLKVDDRLQGKVDYFILAKHRVLIVAAKNAELERAFKQLAVELIALDRWLDDSTDLVLHGAVSIGNVWQFGILHRSTKRFVQDINTWMISSEKNRRGFRWRPSGGLGRSGASSGHASGATGVPQGRRVPGFAESLRPFGRRPSLLTSA
jgi:hypothetical protein